MALNSLQLYMQLIAQHDDLWIYIWISVLIIQLAAVTPYRRLQIVPTTAEAWKCRFDPFFVRNVFFICIRKPQNFWAGFQGFSPLKKVFFFPNPLVRLEFFQNCGLPRNSAKSQFSKIVDYDSTDAYRGSPPYAIFQIPDNREIQYSNMLVGDLMVGHGYVKNS